MCKILKKIFGGGGGGSSVAAVSPEVDLPPSRVSTGDAAASAIDDLAFGTRGLAALLSRKKRGRNFAAGATTDVATLGVKLGD